jgi:glutamine amidotransferase
VTPGTAPLVAIVDYDMGNIFSVKHACETVGLRAMLTSSPREIERADAAILPGVGAFGDAMDCLERLDLVTPLRDRALSGKPVIGICLGMELLMTESHEFGVHRGLGVIPGTVVHFGAPRDGTRVLKVPHVGWNRVHVNEATSSRLGLDILGSDNDGESMYFVHSYVVRPDDLAVMVATTCYGDTEFCSVMARESVVGFQFHPERSGPAGLHIYANIARWLQLHLEA